MSGQIHSTYAGGMSDGPGIRFVVFLAGCPKRCLYCHNPDTWSVRGASEQSADALVAQAQKYRNFFAASGGGITASGGEPLMQPDFLVDLARKSKNAGLSFVLDTSGYDKYNIADKILPLCDVVLLDVKTIDPDEYKRITSLPIDLTLRFLQRSADMGCAVWVRFTLVPGLNDDPEHLRRLGQHLAQYANIRKIDISPFHKSGEFKWLSLGLKYDLGDTQPPTAAQIADARRALMQ